MKRALEAMDVITMAALFQAAVILCHEHYSVIDWVCLHSVSVAHTSVVWCAHKELRLLTVVVKKDFTLQLPRSIHLPHSLAGSLAGSKA